jgi:regulator of nonsense transcripts 1
LPVKFLELNIFKVRFRYCGFHEPSSVALCTICNKWFCNSKGNTAGSHIVTHMVRSGHRELSLHRDGPLGDAALECKSILMIGIFCFKGR